MGGRGLRWGGGESGGGGRADGDSSNNSKNNTHCIASQMETRLRIAKAPQVMLPPAYH